MRIGVISDTHGYLEPSALTALQGVAQIFHAGDIGALSVISALEAIAPVTAVQGNVDAGTALGRQFPITQRLTLEEVKIYITHIGDKPADLVRRLPQPRPDVYIFGHTHIPLLETHDHVLFLNPGAAGRRRFGGGVSIALLDLSDGKASAQIVPL